MAPNTFNHDERSTFEIFLKTEFTDIVRINGGEHDVCTGTLTPREHLYDCGAWEDLTDATQSWIDFARECDDPLTQLALLQTQLATYSENLARVITLYKQFREQISESALHLTVLRENFCTALEGYYDLPESFEARKNLIEACIHYPEDDACQVYQGYGHMVSAILGLSEEVKVWPFATAAALIGKALSAEFGLEEAA